MSLRENRITSDREQHTVYLTRELWEAVERQHLELRLRSSEPPSKIEFIEQVLRAGLHAVAQGTGSSGALRSAHRPVPAEEATPARRKVEPGPSVDQRPVPKEPRRASRSRSPRSPSPSRCHTTNGTACRGATASDAGIRTRTASRHPQCG